MIELKTKFKKINLKASSLIEALIALVILIIITTFILLIMNNVNNKGNIELRTRAFNEVNNVFYTSIKDEDFTERNIDYKNFYIICKTSDYEETNKLTIFRVVAFFSNGKQIVSKQRLVRTPDKVIKLDDN